MPVPGAAHMPGANTAPQAEGGARGTPGMWLSTEQEVKGRPEAE